jgi:hypothetical protein
MQHSIYNSCLLQGQRRFCLPCYLARSHAKPFAFCETHEYVSSLSYLALPYADEHFKQHIVLCSVFRPISTTRGSRTQTTSAHCASSAFATMSSRDVLSACLSSTALPSSLFASTHLVVWPIS